MSILNVNKINPVGGGSTITIAGIASVTSNVSVSGSIVAGTTITGEHHGDGSNLTGIDATKIETGNTKLETIDTGSDGHIKVTTEGTERLRIDSSGRVLIGTTDPGGGNADDLTVATSGNTGITIRSGTSNTGNIFWSDATSGTDQYIGAIEFHHSDNSMNFNIANSIKLKIDSNGNVTKPSTPAFHVSRQGGNVSSNNYVIFDHVDYNNGSHYNNSNGRFTAPVTGIYFFSAWHFTDSTSAFYLRINGSTFGEYAWDDTGGCATWVCPMTANQYAQIYTKYTWRGNSDYHNAFCGYLIG